MIEVKNLVKKYGNHTAVDHLNFTIEEGHVYGFLGPNGAGKSTTMNIMTGYLGATEGEVLINGHDILKEPEEAKKQIGYLPEERGLYPKKIIIDQLTYFAELKGMSHKAAAKSVDYWLERLGMAEYRNKRLDTLSKGNQQKIQLVTALAHDPAIAILDEPFSGLDPVNAMLLKDVVKEQIAAGKIVLFSSHQMNYIEEFCDSIAILNDGRVAIQGELHEIKRNYVRDRLVVRTEQPDRIQAELGERCTVMEDEGMMIQ